MNLSCYGYLKFKNKDNGDFTAVISNDKNVKYSNFVEDIRSLSGYLSSLGIKKGDTVSVFLPTVADAFVSFYAINRLGAVANVIHPLTPVDELKEILESVESKAIFVMDILYENYADFFNDRGEPVILCSNSDYASPLSIPVLKAFQFNKTKDFPKIIKSIPYRKALTLGKEIKTETVNDGSLQAVFLHGGGTTGKSKTIMLTNDHINNVSEHIQFIDTVPHKPGEESALVVLPMFHAFGLAIAMHFSLSRALSLIPVPLFSAEEVNKLATKYKVAFLLGVPDMFAKMVDEEHFEGPHLKNYRMVYCGGDFLSERLVKDFNSKVAKWGGKGRLFRGYGLTEVTSVCCVNFYDRCKENSIGKEIDGVHIEIWDDNRKRVPPDKEGEIVIRGDTVMIGYFTGDKNSVDEGVYTDKNGTRWVLTGDLGKMDSDGFIYFTGRKKRMIIISGYNVYPSDIENMVLQLPYVREVCAVQGYRKSNPCVKLCLSLYDSAPDKPEKQILNFCKKNLSKFSYPRKVEIMEALPRTKMGKIDFVKLSDVYEEAENE